MKNLHIFIGFIGSMLLLWFGLVIFLIGKEMYGTDGVLLFASGIMVILSIHTLSDIFSEVMDKYKK